jgi:TRAP-type C4-dicarboxylate transport system substrate-binding protein/TRAP-type C4-dicarboxylate transport system permease small subunit
MQTPSNSPLATTRRTFQLTATALAFSVLAPAAWAQTKWDLASAYPATNFHTENIVQFAADVDKATNGALKIQVHPNAALFKAPEIKRAVQGGQAQAGEILLANYENESPLFGADGVPFLATSYKNAKSLHEAQRPILARYLEKQGLMVLYTVPWPAQGLFSKKEVSSIADMRRIKWRAYSPATAKMGELMAANSVTVQAAELSQAMATGVVEAFMTSSTTGVDSKIYEHIRNFYDVQAWLPKNAVLVNTKAFQALDKAQQEAVLKAAAAAEERGWKLSQDKNDAAKKTLADRGVKVHEPSSKLVSDMKQVGWTMLQDWQKKAGPDGEAIVAAYMKTPAFGAAPQAGQAGVRQEHELMNNASQQGAALAATAGPPLAIDPAIGRAEKALMRKLLDGAYLAAGGLAALCVLAICVLMIGQSILREFSVRTGATNDVVAWLCAAAAFLAMAHAFKHGDFVRVTLLLEKVSAPVRRTMEIISLLIACLAIGYLAWWATRFAWESYRFNDMANGLLAIPLWIPQTAFVAGSWLFFIAVLDEMVLVALGARPTYVTAVEARHAHGDFSSDL